jgi:hypothetical protein
MEMNKKRKYQKELSKARGHFHLSLRLFMGLKKYELPQDISALMRLQDPLVFGCNEAW